MEREYWCRVTWALRRLPRRCPRGAVYDNRQVLAVLLWAALHERSINWACQREHWPAQAWRRALPDQSTMSRRLKDPLVLWDLWRLTLILQRRWGPPSDELVLDGKPLAVSIFSGDPDACFGWGAGQNQRGYKLHALIDSAQRLLAWEVHPMNVAECIVAADLLKRAHAMGLLPKDALVRADASYDSNALHSAAAETGVRLVAPRRRPKRSISDGHRQHPGRLASINATEGPAADPRDFGARRGEVERYFGSFSATGGCLTGLPAWARRLHRVRGWVGAKTVINTARLSRRRTADA